MALYGYRKAPSKKLAKLEAKTKCKKFLSLILSIGGLVLVGNAVIPLLSYQLRYSARFGRKILSPLAQTRSQSFGSIGASAQEDQKDYTMVSSWFEEPVQLKHQTESRVTDYRLTIPELGIEDAWVQIGGEDLKKKLVHYPDTALPGKRGNAVVFGHSVLPQFFKPNNYLTIFSTLHTLESGDKVIINYDGIEYQYLVEKMFEVKPSDVSVLGQQYNSRYLTLITCTPPGTYLRRLVVRARLLH